MCAGGLPGKRRAMATGKIAVLDVDGTLVDSNYQHALAWYRAFRALGETYPVWRIHRLIGMGGDQLVSALGGEDVEQRIGDQAREKWVEEVDPLIPEMAPLPGARDLLVALRERGHRVVLASSGKPQHVEHYLDLLDLVGCWTQPLSREERAAASLVGAARHDELLREGLDEALVRPLAAAVRVLGERAAERGDPVDDDRLALFGSVLEAFWWQRFTGDGVRTAEQLERVVDDVLLPVFAPAAAVAAV